MKKHTLTVVVAVVFSIFVVGLTLWQKNVVSNYEAIVVAEWSGLEGALSTIDAAIATKSKDFSDIGKSVNDLKARADSSRTKLSSLTPPGKYRTFHANLLAYFEQVSKSLAVINDNCTVWSATKIAELDRETTTCRDLAKTCANAWGGRRPLNYKSDLFAQVPSTFNAMRKARQKQDKVLPPGTTFVGGTQPVGFVLTGSNDIENGYILQMQNILRQYKASRSGLNRFIDYVKAHGQSLENSAYTVEFDDAVAKRQDLLYQIRNITPPVRWQSWHQSAGDCISYGLAAMQSLREGDYRSFSDMSADNTKNVKRIMSAYKVQ